MWGHELIVKGSMWKVGSGNNMNVYGSFWILRPYSFKLFSLRVLPAITNVQELKTATGFSNEDLIRHCFVEEKPKLILQISTTRLLAKDTLC